MRYAASLVLLAFAAAVQAGPALRVSDAWVRAIPGADVAAVYFVLHNAGPAAVTLRAVHSPVAGGAMVHETRLTNGQAQMRPRDSVTVAPGASATFSPGALHVMLTQLRGPLAVGTRVPLVLEFEGGERLETFATVRAPGAE